MNAAERLDTELLEHEARRIGLVLKPLQFALFRRYYQELCTWNARLNLTTIVDWEAVQVQHFLDSLTCVLALPDSARNAPYAIVDIGSGAGFPGIPLKIALPHITLALVESVQKKAAFLTHLVEVLGLQDVRIYSRRAEEVAHFPECRERFDLAVSRAVAPLPVVAEYCLPFVRKGGRMIAMKGRDVQDEIRAGAPAVALLGGQLREVLPVHLPTLDAPRHLVVVDKVSPSPPRYPRRPGLPTKRPLLG
ncbi:MAG: 16S rRNA (guanine(527)-N(7))-methyltransferase RsmG [Chloroflexia bacterium]